MEEYASGKIGIQKKELKTMSTEENKTLVKQALNELYEAMKGGDIDAYVEKFVSNDFICHDPVTGEGDLEALENEIKELRDAFPDLEWTVEDMIAEGDKVVIRVMHRATHQGEFMGIKPTGKQVAYGSTTTFRLKDGKLAEEWVYSDYLGLMQQLGVIPPMGQDEM